MNIGRVQQQLEEKYNAQAWQTVQNISASDYYNNTKGIIAKDIIGLITLSNLCQRMANSYDQVIEDQNEYIIDFEEENKELGTYKEEQNEKLQKLFNEIKALEVKELNGTITEEEQKELESKKTEYYRVSGEMGSKVSEKNEKLNKIASEQEDRYLSKVKAAKSYGEFTLQKGYEKYDCKAGERAVDTANDLLDKVKESNDLDADFKNRLKGN